MAEINNTEVLKVENDNQSTSSKIKGMLFNNVVTIIFIVICLIGIKVSELPLFFIVSELLTRVTRNSFLVLSLIIPVIAGMGLNFGITIGAMAGQMAIIAVTYWGVTGFSGFLLCIVLSAPMAIFFGHLIGKLLNKTKGQEMIASMIAGFFANGIYQFIFLFAIGTFIPMKDPVLVLSSGVGIRNTIDLSRNVGIKYALDNISKGPLFQVAFVVAVIGVLYYIYKILKKKGNQLQNISVLILYAFVGLMSGLFITGNVPKNLKMLSNIKVSLSTFFVIGALCVFTVMIIKTKIGQEFRTVGQDKHIASVSGINVNKIRLIAIMISTLLAAWGQIIFLQNMGTLNTYGSHVQIATFSIAALLIGGASVSRATIGQALLGTILFHTLFIVSPKAGKNLFGDAQIGEYFRAFVAYGVIGLSLGLHAWKKQVQAKKRKK